MKSKLVEKEMVGIKVELEVERSSCLQAMFKRYTNKSSLGNTVLASLLSQAL